MEVKLTTLKMILRKILHHPIDRDMSSADLIDTCMLARSIKNVLTLIMVWILIVLIACAVLITS